LAARCRPKVISALRRCISGGIIGLPLLGGGPSFKAEQESEGGKDHAHSQNTKSLQPAFRLVA